MSLEPLGRVDTTPLFAPLHGELMALVRNLSGDDWLRPTVAGTWRVRDVAAHLLDGQLRGLSLIRDGHGVAPDSPVESYDDLVGFLDRLNSDWVKAMERASPRVLTGLLGLVGRQAAEMWQDQDLDGPAPFPVDWADTDRSQLWMHAGREYTEVWHHQMQIRDAVGAPRLLAGRWLQPLLDLSMRALPRSYEGIDSEVGTTLVFEVTGDGGGVWTLRRDAERWRVFRGAPEAPDAVVRLPDDESWRLLYNARTPEESRRRSEVTGDEALAAPLFLTRSVMVRVPASGGN